MIILNQYLTEAYTVLMCFLYVLTGVIDFLCIMATAGWLIEDDSLPKLPIIQLIALILTLLSIILPRPETMQLILTT